VRKTVSLRLGEVAEPQARLRAAGLTLTPGEQPTITNVAFGSAAKRVGLEPGYKITAIQLPAPGRPSAAWIYAIALALAALVWWLQRRRSTGPASATLGVIKQA
jgi:hypothetical protein